MRIALFSPTIDILNGYGNITAEYCRALHAIGIDFVLYLPRSESGRISSMQLSYKVECTLPENYFRFYQKSAWKHLFAPRLQGFDLVHSLFDFPHCVLAARAAKKSGLPFMMGVQGTYGIVPLLFWPERLAMKWCYRRAKRIVVPSVFTKDMIEKHTGEKYPIDVIHNGVNLARFDRKIATSALRSRYAGKTILLTVGGIKERKGQDLVIQSLSAILKHHPNVVYVIVGDGPLRKSYENVAREFGVLSSVDFVGNKNGDELVQYFHACDIHVHTPRVVNYNFEGFGIVYLEASACGKPIVATDAGGIRDAVIDDQTGLIAPDGDITGIAGSILRIMNDTALAQRLGAAGREYARKHDWVKMVHKFVSVYREILPQGHA